MTRKTLADLAALCGAVLEGDGSVEVRGPAPLADAGPDQVSFLAHPKYAGQLADTSAAAVLMGEGVAEVPAGINILRHGDPGQAFTKIILAFRPPRTPMPAGVHPSAVVHGEAQVSPGVSIGPCCTVGAGTVLSDGVILHGGVHLAEETSVGRNSELHPGVVLYPGTSVGANCLIHAGAVLGADGFGFEPSAASGASGTGVAGWQKVPQCGTVEIGDCVEIGANCAIDRGRFGPTRIGSGSKLDNLVHVAHNVQVGEHALLIAQVGVAGSSRVGNGAILAGQVGLSGHLEVGDGARVGAASAIFQDIPAGEDWFGSPAEPRTAALRRMARQRRLGAVMERLREHEARLSAVETERNQEETNNE